ncbi:TonB-dependent receptor [Parabacteroides sp. OttesenSCG-928-N08]|nr:TonB-dependent receptor [Parabacteroides sp. OttesenSCG-928-N08]
MKSGRVLWVLILLVMTISAKAQSQRQQGRQQAQSVEVKGVVVEENTGIPVEQATVRLLSVKDSTFVGGVASERSGAFSLKNVKPGDYLIHVTFIGYEPLYQPVKITGRTNPVEMGKLEMSDGAILLGEAVAVGKQAEVVVRNDTIEYNAESFKVTEGSVLEDLLKKMPGVEVDSDGKITVNGKEVKKMLVDGKEFFTDDPKVASKNLPADMIDKVQVLDRLSEMAQMTGFDDGDEETVINLTVKPGMKQGWFGNAMAGYGSKDRYEGMGMVNRFINNDQFTVMGGINNTNNQGASDLGSAMFSGMGGGGRGGFGGGGGQGITSSANLGLNASKEFSPQITLGGNGHYSHSDNLATNRFEKENIRDEAAFQTGEDRNNRISDSFGANLRFEWKPDDKTRILFRPNFRYSKNSQTEESEGIDMDALRDTISVGKINNISEGEAFNFGGNLEFSRKLNDAGRTLSASLSGNFSDSESNDAYWNEVVYKNDNDRIELLDQRINYQNNGYNYRAFVSWVEPLGRNNFLQLTYSFSQRQQESIKNAYNKAEDSDRYSVIDTAQSKNYRNDFINQRVSLSFKSVREKFNYTLGVNFDPSYTKSENFIGDTTLFSMSRNVFNVSPMAQLRYNFNRQTNLRVDYNGRVSQPSMTQLMPVPDYSDVKNVRVGNPDLKPRYVNNISARYQSFAPESQLAMMVMADGQFTTNDIVSYSVNHNDQTGKKTTSYKNINGNWNGRIRFMMNTPLKNKRFTVSNMTMASYSNSNTIIGDSINGAVVDSKNSNRNMMLMERASIDFRSDYIDVGVNGNVRYTRSRNTLNTTSDNDVFNYGVGGNTVIYLPYNMKLESDIRWSTNSGYSSNYSQDELMWNASASVSFLKGNAATLRLKIYDILKQRSNISYSTNAMGSTYSEYNTLNSYFMVHFIYRFSIFKGGATMNDAFGGRGGMRHGGPGGPGGPPRMF